MSRKLIQKAVWFDLTNLTPEERLAFEQAMEWGDRAWKLYGQAKEGDRDAVVQLAELVRQGDKDAHYHLWELVTETMKMRKNI
jgi:hypothetical protein